METGIPALPMHPVARCLVFDSGIGGMGVVRALRDLLPGLQIDYLADTALFPYGEQPDDLLTVRIVDLLSEACAKLAPDILVIACNTASTIALPALRARLAIPVVGCVPPIRWAGRVSSSRVIGLLSTSATARRPYILQLHRDFAADCRLLTHGARRLADLAEQAFLGQEIADRDIRYELDCLFDQPHGTDIDTVGLGCTHYTFLTDAFERLSPPGVTWLDPAPAVARQVQTVIGQFLDARLDGGAGGTRGNNTEGACTFGHLLVTRAPIEGISLEHAVRRLGFGCWELFDASSCDARDLRQAV